jgi:alpha-tubulin suppressor-like RCC1 family protein
VEFLVMRLVNFLMVAALSGLVAAPALAQKATTHMRLLSSPLNSAKLGEAVTLSAEVDGLGGGAPNGSVSFLDGSVPLRPAALSPFTSGKGGLAAGLSHTCALTVTGGVKCWGANRRGQLGEGGGSLRSRYIPVDVAGLSSGVVAITAGAEHTCALTYAGAVKCWGVNYSGQLGDGTNNDKSAPSDVSGLEKGVVAISAGRTHTCALTDKGAVKCWGYNYAGALGDGTTTSRNVPVDVFGLSSGAVAISAGGVHSCALTSAGAVRCWGYNGWGQLGDGTRDDRLTPVSVAKLSSGVAEISAGDFHSCALTIAGAVLCWGHNLYGQLGDGTRTGRYTPIAVSGLASGVFAVAAGNYHSCALTSADGVKCWGANGTGELGDGTTISRPTPVAVSGLPSGGVAIAASHASCAQIVNGAVKCWGYNKDGQLGDGTSITRLTPVTTRSLGTLVRARATISTTALGSGLHELKAVYPGDAKHSGSADSVWLRVDFPVYRTEPSRSSSITAIPR